MNIKTALIIVSSIGLAGCVAPESGPSPATLIAHRGESYDAPENTLPAYEAAVARGFGFECDIYLSKDKRLFTFHDGNLTRTTAGANTNRCTDVDWETVSKLNVGGWGKWKGSKFDPTRPALFSEVLALARDGRYIYVEVKGNDPSWVPYIKAEVAKAQNVHPGNVLFISFGDKVCAELKRQMPTYKVFWLVGGGRPKLEGVLKKLGEIGADGLDIYFDQEYIGAAFVRAIRDAGYEIHAWTVDDPLRARQAFAVGVQTLTTNRAKYLFETLAPFREAEPVWPAGLSNVSNVQLRFSTELKGAKDAVLRVTGADAYRIEMNGAFVGYGPARGPRGVFRVDEWTLPAADGRLDVVVQGNNCCNYYFAENRPFLQAEVVCGSRIVAATKATDGAFVARPTERIRRTPRYSFQRAYAEAYRLGGAEADALQLETCPPVAYLDRVAPYPPFEMNRNLRLLSQADVGFGDLRSHPAAFDTMVGPVDVNNWVDLRRLAFTNRTAMADASVVSLADGRSVRMDAGLNDCGFYGMTVEVRKPGRLVLDFDEVLNERGEVNASRMFCCNAVEWLFEKPGRYAVETFEPYVWRYANLSAFDGDFTVSDRYVRTYKNGETGRARFRCSDTALEKIFAAAKETYAENAVDVFTDCPSRERAGWLCDSFFIGRVNKLLCGDAQMERLFLQNYVLAKDFGPLPDGALPMCYPSAHANGNFIPNWVMWLILETEEYLARSGDRVTVDALKPRLVKFVEYLNGFRNSDGLLEKLPKWVFVEWSRANKLVQDVNYPSNMAWAETLEAMNRLYGMPELAVEAAKIRETVRKQSWTGRWFCDNAVRQKDGTLKLSGECTETCQYYAFFFKTATPETHPELWKTLLDDFGPKRKVTKAHPEIWPSNAFIGNYLRLELLSRAGLVKNILDETKGFFLYMADRTGTLWEFDSPLASCCHGFASHAAVYLYRDVLGVKSIDTKRRTAVVVPPAGLDLDWCEGTLPVSPTETVTVGWRKGEKPTVRFSAR